MVDVIGLRKFREQDEIGFNADVSCVTTCASVKSILDSLVIHKLMLSGKFI